MNSGYHQLTKNMLSENKYNTSPKGNVTEFSNTGQTVYFVFNLFCWQKSDLQGLVSGEMFLDGDFIDFLPKA